MKKGRTPIDHWIDTLLTSFFAALIPTMVLAATTRDLWTLGVTLLGTFATGVVQHRRQIPREEWTNEVRAEKRYELKEQKDIDGQQTRLDKRKEQP